MRASIVGLTVLVAAASPAAAQSKADKAKAKKLYDSGLNHYNLAEYPEAIKDWKEAYSISKKALLLFNIGQAYRLAGDCKLAGTFYDSYQREEPNPKNQDELDQALALCAKDPDKPIDNKPIDKKPVQVIKAPVADTPVGKPVDKPTEPIKKGPDVGQAGGEGEVDQSEPTSTTTGGGLRKVGIGVGALGVVLGGVGIYFALDSKSISDELSGFDTEWGDEEVALEAKGKRSARLGWILGGTGIAAIVAGGVMFAIGGPKATEASSVAIVPTRGGAAVGWSFKF